MSDLVTDLWMLIDGSCWTKMLAAKSGSQNVKAGTPQNDAKKR